MNKLIWNLKTRYYKLFRSSFPFKIILNRENSNLAALLKQVETENKIMLDLGVGTGNVLKFLNGARHIVGVDLTFSMLGEAHKNFPNVELIQADILSIPVKTKTFDMITAVGLIEYFRDTISFIDELCRILKNEGYLVLTFSPKNIWTRMRFLLGVPVYSMSFDQLKEVVKISNLRIIDYQQSMMQRQVLLKKVVE